MTVLLLLLWHSRVLSCAQDERGDDLAAEREKRTLRYAHVLRVRFCADVYEVRAHPFTVFWQDVVCHNLDLC